MMKSFSIFFLNFSSLHNNQSPIGERCCFLSGLNQLKKTNMMKSFPKIG